MHTNACARRHRLLWLDKEKGGFKLLRAVRNPICSHEQIISIAYAELRTTYTNKNNSFLLLWNPCSTPTKYYY